MNKFELTKKIEKIAPIETQDFWDCSGWVICTNKKDVSKVMLALTITNDVYNQAKEKNCDMIISHHPLFFVPLKYSDIDIYCSHTNMDKAIGGTTDTLLETLGLKADIIVEEYVRVVELKEEIDVEEFKERLKTISPNLRYINNNKIDKIRTIGFCAGAGSEFINAVETDAFVTGDLKFHTALDSKKVVFDIGHFESEILILKKFAQILEIDTICANENSPFIY